MCVMHTDTALSCILLNNTQHTPVNSLSTLTFYDLREKLSFKRQLNLLYIVQTMIILSVHCIFSLVVIIIHTHHTLLQQQTPLQRSEFL